MPVMEYAHGSGHIVFAKLGNSRDVHGWGQGYPSNFGFYCLRNVDFAKAFRE
ncbi:MAG: hypothetical protein KJ892_07905 [Gammaproteobacteria bacterium]|nr:hypothetical protein [Gammaproteobacteria bacterium]